MTTLRTAATIRRAVLTGLLTLTVLATGCGASGGKAAKESVETTTTEVAPADPDDAVRAAVDATLDASSFTVASKAKLEIGPKLVRLSSRGSFDYDTTVGDVLINLDSTSDRTELAVRSNGKTFWVRAEGDQTPTIPDGKTWIEGDARTLSRSTSLRPAGLTGVVIALRASKNAKQVETGSTDGVDTTTYETTVGYDDAVDAAGDDAEAFTSALSLRAATSPDLKITVEIGSDGIIRSFDLDVQSSNGTPLDGTYQVDLSDVNKEVEVPDAPPADDTLTGPRATKLLEQLIK